MKKILSNYKFFLIATILLWLKTYFVCRYYFDLSIENNLQEIILFISPLSSALIFFWLSLLVKEKHRNKSILFTSFICSIIIYANVLFYRFFTDFITIPVLFQTDNASDLGSSIHELIFLYDVVFFLDFILLLLLMKFIKKTPVIVNSRGKLIIFMSAIATFTINLGLAEIERPQLLTRTFDREMLIKNIGTFNYHIYDIFIQSKAKAQRAFADGNQLTEIENTMKANKIDASENMKGIAKGKNVVVISMESLQSFVINNKVDSHTITPFLNKLIKESYYFPNFYHQTAQGKTSDSEFILENSLYPLPSGAVFFTHSQNKYRGLPNILGENGYYSAVLHANNKSFWNRDVMYPNLGYSNFFDEDSFNITKENSVGWGLKDKDLFEQSINHLKSLPEPYYAKYITLTNHFPFSLEEEDELIPEWTSNDKTVNRYFTTVRYMDESLKRFFALMKKEDLYKNTIFILYGDHYGISENHNKAMGEFLGKEITPFESLQLQRVPLIIHIPGKKGKIIEEVSGQIDLKPTILNLLGVDTKEELMFGSDLFSKDRKDLTILRSGSFISKDYVYTKNKCYSREDGLEVEKINCEPFIEISKKELDFSDKIIYGDLFRFFGNNEKELKEINIKNPSLLNNVESESEIEMESELKKKNAN